MSVLWANHQLDSGNDLLNINQREEMLEHERVIRFWVIPWNPNILVHIETDHILFISLADGFRSP
jgi:hypothetical protein